MSIQSPVEFVTRKYSGHKSRGTVLFKLKLKWNFVIWGVHLIYAKSYTVFLSDLMKMDVLVTKTTKKKKYLKSLTWFLSLIICTVQYFGPVIRSPLPPPPNLCTEFGQHVGGLRIISWPCTSLAGMCRLFWGGFPDRRQLCSITSGPPPPFPNKTAGILSFGKEKSERGRVVIKSHFAFWFSRYKMLIFPLWSKILVLHTIKVDVR